MSAESLRLVKVQTPEQWAATKTRVGDTLTDRSHVQMGLRYANDVPELVAEVEALRELVRLQNENLSAVQAASTALVNEIRGHREYFAGQVAPWDVVPPSFPQVLYDLVGVRYASDCKHGSAADQIGRPNGTGGNEWVEHLAEMRAGIEAVKRTGELTWFDLLACEIAEAKAESEPARLREELLDVANVATKWIETIDLRVARDEGTP